MDPEVQSTRHKLQSLVRSGYDQIFRHTQVALASFEPPWLHQDSSQDHIQTTSTEITPRRNSNTTTSTTNAASSPPVETPEELAKLDEDMKGYQRYAAFIAEEFRGDLCWTGLICSVRGLTAATRLGLLTESCKSAVIDRVKTVSDKHQMDERCIHKLMDYYRSLK